MFRKEFADVISKTGMIPIKDIRELLTNKDRHTVTELELLKFDFFDDVKFAKLLADKYSMTYIDLSKAKIGDNVLSLVKKSDAIKFRVIPIQKTAKAVSIAVYDPSLENIKGELQTLFQHNVELILTNIDSWKLLYNRLSDSIDDILDSIREVRTENVTDDSPADKDIGDDVIRLVNKILAEAFIKKASDIHVEPYEHIFRIRFRIDGTLQEISRPNAKLVPAIVSRMKILSQMDIAEKRKPQDGRIKLEIGGKPIDYRVSSLPTLFGEKVCLRLLDSSNLELDMTKLGFEKKQLDVFQEGIHRPFGMCLVTGPTGSGKTTTLYSALAELNTVGKKIRSDFFEPITQNGMNQFLNKNIK